MKQFLRNLLAVIAGAIVGGAVNMSIIMISGSLIPPPEGADLTTMEGLEASIPLFQPRHFIMPFLAHALGTLVGGLIAALIGVSRKMILAIIIGLFFLAGGAKMVIDLPSPMWFNVLDLAIAYIPMAYLGGRIAMRKNK